MSLAVRLSKGADVEALAPLLREADLDEIAAASGHPPVSALAQGFRLSDPCWTGYDADSGVPCAMFGVVPGDSGVGHPWLLGSDVIARRPKSFSRLAREFLPVVEDGWDVLWNWVMEANTVHVRWLQALGFEFIGRDDAHGVKRVPFLLFMKHV